MTSDPMAGERKSIARLITAIALALATIGVFLFGIFFYRVPLVASAQGYSTTEGIVEKSDTVYSRSDNRGRKSRSAEMSYRYSVGDKKYTSSLISHADPKGQLNESVDVILNRYPVGKNVVVFYDATDPTIAVLERGNLWTLAPLMAWGSGLLLACFFIIRWVNRHLKPRRAATVLDGIRPS
jgi:hypothetical protein